MSGRCQNRRACSSTFGLSTGGASDRREQQDREDQERRQRGQHAAKDEAEHYLPSR
jgi:hypothetical protein